MNTNANLNATIGIFFDSFAKIAVSITALSTVIHLPVKIITQNIIPGLCISLFLLNFAYYRQAQTLSRQTKNKVTALPNGLQASCVFVWLFAIMLPISTATNNPVLAYKVALLANFINAITFSIVGVILVKFLRYIPPPALFSGLAGSAFTWLAINNLSILFEHPLSGLLPMLIILALSIAKLKVKVPTIIIGVILGSFIAIATNEFKWSLASNLHFLGVYPPRFLALDMSNIVMTYCIKYLPIILAFAIIDAVSAIQILEESKLSNDNFNPYQSILISGIISGLSSFIGNPFAMALFFGHYSWKKQGANHSYPLYNGVIYLIIGLSGVAMVLISVIPEWVTLPILIIIGITTTAVSFQELNKDEYILLVIGIIPILTELIYNKLELLALQNNIHNFLQLAGVTGLFILAKGSILFSLIITSIFYYVMYHRWLHVAIGFIILVIVSSTGLIHSQTPGLHVFTTINYTYFTCALLSIFTHFMYNSHESKI